MELPLVTDGGCACKQSDNKENQLPSLDDYDTSTVTITYLPSTSSYTNVDTGENFRLNKD